MIDGAEFYESGLQKIKVTIDINTYILPLLIIDDHYAQFYIVDQIKQGFPNNFTIQVSMNGQEYSDTMLTIQALVIDSIPTYTPQIGSVTIPTTISIGFKYWYLSDLECSYCYNHQCVNSIPTLSKQILLCTTPPPEQFSIDLKTNGGIIQVFIKRKSLIFTSAMSFEYYTDIIFDNNEGMYFPSRNYPTYTLNFGNSFKYNYSYLQIELTDFSSCDIFAGNQINPYVYEYTLHSLKYNAGASILISVSFNNQSFQYMSHQSMIFSNFIIQDVIPAKIPINQDYPLNIYTSISSQHFFNGMKCVFNGNTTTPITYCNNDLIICNAPNIATQTVITLQIILSNFIISDNYANITYTNDNQNISINPSIIYNKYTATTNVITTGLINYMIIYSEITSYTSLYMVQQTILLNEMDYGAYSIYSSADGYLWSKSNSSSITSIKCATTKISINNTCTQCDQNYICSQSLNQQISCGRGFIALNNQCLLCSIGNYCPFEAQSGEIICPVGYICSQVGASSESELELCHYGSICSNNNQMFSCPIGYWCGEGIQFNTSIASDYTTPQLCYDGTYCNNTSSVWMYGISCQKGSYCNAGTMYLCQQGYNCPYLSMIAPLPCFAGFYSDHANKTQCNKCELGTFCPVSMMNNPVICTEGNNCFLFAQSMPAEMCKGGTYCGYGVLTNLKNIDQSFDGFNSNPCDIGTYCLPGTWNKTINSGVRGYAEICREGTYCLEETGKPEGTALCPAGFYCPLGISDPLPADVGYYCNGEGNTRQTPCPPGTYTNVINSTACSACPVGYFCINEATVAPVICPKGTFRELNSNTIFCENCPEGTWSNKTGLTNRGECMLCRAGIVCDQEGMTSQSQARQCAEGYLCPEGTRSDNEFNNPCPAGYWCGEGTSSIVDFHLCEQSYFCLPSTTQANKNKNICKKGYFCPRGTMVTTTNGVIVFSIVNSSEVIDAKINRFKNQGIDDADIHALAECLENNLLPDTLVNTYSGLQCPDATTSDSGSYCLGQCIQISGASPVATIDPFASNSTRKLVESNITFISPLSYALLKLNLSTIPSALIYSSIYTIILKDHLNNPLSLPTTYINKLKVRNCDIVLKLMNPNKVNFGFILEINIVNGLFAHYDTYFNGIGSIEIYESRRASLGSNQLFGVFLSKALFDGVALPYNLPDVKGLPSFFIDIVDSSVPVYGYSQNYTEDPIESTYWIKNSVKSVGLNFLPFHSACLNYGKHVIISELLQDPNNCELVGENQTKIVNQVPFFLSGPVADKCNQTITCRYEEPLLIPDKNQIRWYEIKQLRTIYYITRNSMTVSNFQKADDSNEYETYYANKLANDLDSFIPVTIKGENSSGFPHLVTYSIAYKQENLTTKILVSLHIQLSNYTSDNTTYTLKISFSPMIYNQLLNNFQFSYWYYFILFIGIALTLVLLAFVTYLLNVFIIRKKYLPIKLKQFFEATLEAPLLGAALGQLPAVALIGFSYLMRYFPLKSNATQWNLLGISETADQQSINSQGRSGACFLIGSLILSSIGSKMMISKPKAKEQPRLKEIEKVKQLNNLKMLKENDDEDEVELSDREFDASTDFNSIIKNKKRYFIFNILFFALGMMYLLKFSFTKVFQNNVIYFQLSLVLIEILLEQILTRVVVKEALLVSPLLTSLMVTEFVMTLGSSSFLGFIISYYIEHMLAIVTRIYLEPLIEKIEFLSFKLFLKLCAKYKWINRLVGEYVKNSLMYYCYIGFKEDNKPLESSLVEREVTQGMDKKLC